MKSDFTAIIRNDPLPCYNCGLLITGCGESYMHKVSKEEICIYCYQKEKGDSSTDTEYFLVCCNKRIAVLHEGEIACETCGKKYIIQLKYHPEPCSHRWYLVDDTELLDQIVVECNYCDRRVRFILHPDDVI